MDQTSRHKGSGCVRVYTSLYSSSFQFVFFENFQTFRQLDRPYGFSLADFLQCVLIDSTAHEFPLWGSLDPQSGNSCAVESISTHWRKSASENPYGRSSWRNV